MKNLLGALVLFLAFTVNANAQETFKKLDEKVEAKKNLVALLEVVTIDENLSLALIGLFEYKFSRLNENLSADSKIELANIIEAKLRATFTETQMKSIENKKGLLKKLTN
ncbi:hypothetical protein [Flavobacterium sp.]|jgi:formate/nitrite transporter FocA (FNT family)|uniref:hypothetical protein n=1 Tax=Flavobacterium sp. TaxID=239 RepID=UPI0037BEE9E0